MADIQKQIQDEQSKTEDFLATCKGVLSHKAQGVSTLAAAGPPTMTLVAVPALNATSAIEVSDGGGQAALALASTADVTLHSLMLVPFDTAMASTSAGSEFDNELDSERDFVGDLVALEARTCLGLLTCSASAAVANGRESRASQNTQTYAELLSAPEVSGGAVSTDDLDGTVHSAAGGINADDSVTEGCDADTECSDNEEVGVSDDSGHDTEIEDNVIEIGADVLDECTQVHPGATQADDMDAEDAPVDDDEAEATEVESSDEVEPTQLESDDEVAPKGDTVSPQTTTPTALHPNVQSGIPVAVVGTIVSERPAEQEEMTTTMTVTTTTMTTCEANGLISTLEEATTTTTTTTVRRPKRKASELAAVRVKQQVQGENDGVIEAIREAERHALEAITAEMSERKKEKFKRAQATWHPDTDIEDGDEADRDEDYAVRSKVRRPKKQRRTQVASIMTPSHPVMTTSASSNGATYDAPIDLTAD